MSVTIVHYCDNPTCSKESETRDLPNSGWIVAATLHVADSRIRFFKPDVPGDDGGTWCSWECLAEYALHRGRQQANAAPPAPSEGLPF